MSKRSRSNSWERALSTCGSTEPQVASISEIERRKHELSEYYGYDVFSKIHQATPGQAVKSRGRPIHSTTDRLNAALDLDTIDWNKTYVSSLEREQDYQVNSY